jgi:hypothetical protein
MKKIALLYSVLFINCAKPEDWVLNLSSQIISILSIIVTAWIAITAINKSAKKNRVEKTYDGMLETIIELFQTLHEIIGLLWKVSQKGHVFKMPDYTEIETGYVRYWREIEPLQKRTDALHSRRNLLLPSDLNEHFNRIIEQINEARNFAIDATPENGKNHKEIEKCVRDAIHNYNIALNCARKYSGIDKLDKISFQDSKELLGKENQR